MTYEAYLEWLEQVPLYGQKDGIRNMQALMARFGDPQDQIPVIHVAGTNGKGSCCAMLAQILQESGRHVGLYTSPHLVDYTERIQVDGQPISRTDWVKIGLEVKEAAEAIDAEGGNHATYFEIITAIGFLYFARRGVDVIVLETGVGGRLDATNVVKKPALCLITSISLDHTKVLGTTLPQIAAEKAGILQPGVPVVLAQNPPEVQAVVGEKACQLGCAFYYSGWVQTGPQERRFRSGLFDYADLQTALTGSYQVQNLCAVLCAVYFLQQQGWPITEDSLRCGLQNTRWPGRMERRTYRGRTLLLDGAHNPGGAGMLADYLAQQYPAGSCTLVSSALVKKDVAGILAPLRACPAIGRVIFTCIDGENQMQQLADIWQEGRAAAKEEGPAPAVCIAEPQKALDAAAETADGDGVIVCAGSLYLVGEIEAILNREESCSASKKN